jgi:hypothetical protein
MFGSFSAPNEQNLALPWFITAKFKKLPDNVLSKQEGDE